MPQNCTSPKGQNWNSRYREIFLEGSRASRHRDYSLACFGLFRVSQEPRRPAEEIELATDMAISATIAKVRIITTTEYSLLEPGREGQVSFQTQPLSFHLDAEQAGKILSCGQDKCRIQRTFRG